MPYLYQLRPETVPPGSRLSSREASTFTSRVKSTLSMRMVPGAAPRMGFTWRTSQYVTSPLSSPLSQLLQAASDPASSRVLPGTCSPAWRRRIITWEPGPPAACTQMSCWAASLRTARFPRASLPRRSGYPSELTKSCTCLGTSGSFAGAGTSWLFPGPATMPRRISSRRRPP